MNSSSINFGNTLLTGLYNLTPRGDEGMGYVIHNGGNEPIYERRVNVERVIEPSGRKNVRRLNGFDELYKSKDKYEEVISSAPYALGMAHTRWSTSGDYSLENVHPVASDSGNFYVVLNGAITNHLDLWKDYIKEPRTEEQILEMSDTQTLARLFAYFYTEASVKPTFPALLRRVAGVCKGDFAVIATSQHYEKEMVGISVNQDLYVGLLESAFREVKGTNGTRMQCYELRTGVTEIGSAEYCLSENVKVYYQMNRDDVIHITPYQINYYTVHGLPKFVEHTSKPISYQGLGSRTFLETEIYTQPEIIAAMIKKRVIDEKVVFDEISEEMAETLAKKKIFYFIACGTSYNAARAARQAFIDIMDVPTVVMKASEFNDQRQRINKDNEAACFFITQSGTTKDTLLALRACKEANGAFCVAITNRMASTIAKEATIAVDVHAQAERSVASTKAYTCQYITMVLLAVFLGQHRADLSIAQVDIINDVHECLHTLPDLMSNVLAYSSVDTLVTHLKASNTHMFIARGTENATALEGALKLIELCQLYIATIDSAELMHGHRALIDDRFSIVMFDTTQENIVESIQKNVDQILCADGRPFLISTEGPRIAYYDNFKSGFSNIMPLPRTHYLLQGVLNVVPFQLASLKLAKDLGFDIDHPRRLAKEVNV